MNKDIQIGKFTLETLTTGMYTDSRIIFREYIQNATDAIDSAIKEGLLKSKDEARIDIDINSDEGIISIIDNGCGINSFSAWKTLTDIGNSTKQFDENRGFRGIGRLAGLSYADTLQFITTAYGETTKSIISWDCLRLRELLQPGEYKEYDLPNVIAEVAKLSTEPADEKEHYFHVKLLDVGKEYNDLLDLEEVALYLSQSAPVPFDATRFPFYHDSGFGIKKKLIEIGESLEEYQIFLNDDPNPIYKPYSTRFKSGRGDNTKSDGISKIEYIIERDDNGRLLFWGWYAITGFYGVVKDSSIAGLRLRKGNILIGDQNTLNEFFTEKRFNGYFIGEIYVYDSEVVPNGQRDDFERNAAYWRFKEKLLFHTKQVLSKLPRSYSEYNSAIKKIENGESSLIQIEEKIKQGVSSDKEREELHRKRDKVTQDIDKSKKDLEKSKTKIGARHSENIERALQKAETLKERSEKLENKIIDSDYLLDKERALSGYSKEVKKAIKSIFKIIDTELDHSTAKHLQTKIIEGLKAKKKNGVKKR